MTFIETRQFSSKSISTNRKKSAKHKPGKISVDIGTKMEGNAETIII